MKSIAHSTNLKSNWNYSDALVNRSDKNNQIKIGMIKSWMGFVYFIVLISTLVVLFTR